MWCKDKENLQTGIQGRNRVAAGPKGTTCGKTNCRSILAEERSDPDSRDQGLLRLPSGEKE